MRQLTGLRGIAATADALLLLLQIKFTKHDLWLHAAWTAQTAISATLFTLLCAMVYCYVLLKTSHYFTLWHSSNSQQGELVGVQGQLSHSLKYRFGFTGGSKKDSIKVDNHAIWSVWYCNFLYCIIVLIQLPPKLLWYIAFGGAVAHLLHFASCSQQMDVKVGVQKVRW